MPDYYSKVAPLPIDIGISESPYTRTAGFTLSRAEGYSGGAYGEASAQASERRTSSVNSSEAVYSITGCAL